MKRFTLVPALLFASAVVTAAVATGAVATGAVATGAVATGAVATGAPLPPLAPDELASRADTIITGTVVESRILFHGILGASMHYVRLKVKVENIERGRDQIRGAEFIEVRCWHNARGEADGSTGHQNIPADGARFHAFLTRHQEGYFDALEPNGFEILDGSAERVFPPAEPRTIGTGQIIGGAIGLAVFVAVGFLFFRRRKTE
ncbi:MAG TPA: LPXTG cell wall anchor domain-containing protein [Verrucomicrobiales bacterium]|nr:LPXTG cell wall anchor domain-containing protein [Verrucomicrobiales bacterium]